MSDTAANNLIELAADIVSAYVSNNTVSANDLTVLIGDVYAALQRTSSGVVAEPMPEPLKPAVPIKKSVTPDYIVCLEDGKKFKSLKRHLRTQYNVTPEEYREKWGLRLTIRWSRRTMRRLVRTSPRRWASASSVVAVADRLASSVDYKKKPSREGAAFLFCRSSKPGSDWFVSIALIVDVRYASSERQRFRRPRQKTQRLPLIFQCLDQPHVTVEIIAPMSGTAAHPLPSQ